MDEPTIETANLLGVDLNVERTDPAVDLFITGHTHQINTCIIDGRPVLSAWSFGRLFTQINVELNRVTKDMTVLSAFHWLNARNVPPEPDVSALIDKSKALVATLANTVIGTISADITGARTVAGESALGDMITAAQLAATSAPGFGDADVAFTNSGGIRADLHYLTSGSEVDGEVTYAEAFEVQPFGTTLVTMTLTGAQIDALLKLQVDNPEPGRATSCRFPVVSSMPGVTLPPPVRKSIRRRSGSTVSRSPSCRP